MAKARRNRDWPDFVKQGALLEMIYSQTLVWVSSYDKAKDTWVGMDSRGLSIELDNPHVLRPAKAEDFAKYKTQHNEHK